MKILTRLLDVPFVYRLHASLFNAERLLKTLVTHSRYRPGMRVLDIGCGTGELSRFVRPEDYVGIDISDSYVEAARKAHKGTFLQLPAEKVDQLDDEFDLAFVVGLLHHLADNSISTTLQNLHKVVKCDGRVHVLEAVWPTKRWDLPGYLLRCLDRGDFVRTEQKWRALMTTSWAVIDPHSTRNGVIEYFSCTLAVPK